MEAQQQAYQALIADGGRPSHPLHLIQTVFTSLGEYRDIVTYWQSRPDDWELFTKQLEHWRGFRFF